MTQKQKLFALCLFVLVAGGMYFLVSFVSYNEYMRDEATYDPATFMPAVQSRKSASKMTEPEKPTPSTPDAVATAIIDDATNDASLATEEQDAKSTLNDDALSTNSYDSVYDNQEL